ncbi:MAG: BlaI/MecI/CopY family transcriptional regulator [Chloroflexi bacterium]|nr:BlaI/MecI/CopY family transcriptional regulator [Chloroflexota bacterium]
MPDQPVRDSVIAPTIERIFGPLGSAVMRIVWQLGEATVADVAAALPRIQGRSYAYTTVMTVMSRLFERGVLLRTKSGPRYVYRPAADEPALIDRLSEQAVDQVLARYGTSALRQFAQRLDEVDPALRAQLLELAGRDRPPEA